MVRKIAVRVLTWHKVHRVDSYIAEKTQWFLIYSAHSFSRFNQEVLRVYLSTMLGKQLVIPGIYNGER